MNAVLLLVCILWSRAFSCCLLLFSLEEVNDIRITVKIVIFELKYYKIRYSPLSILTQSVFSYKTLCPLVCRLDWIGHGVLAGCSASRFKLKNIGSDRSDCIEFKYLSITIGKDTIVPGETLNTYSS